ncbi:MAG: hypothetical protein Q9201_003639, partial [Fulgogasparrea decipioides]
MTAPTVNSTTRILRPNSIAKCIEQGVYTAYEEERFLKIGTYHTGSSADYGASILGVFNVSERALAELVPLREFVGVKPGQEYVVRAYPSEEVSPSMGLDDDEFPLVDLRLEEKGWGILIAVPVQSFILRANTTTAASAHEVDDGNKTHIAILGLLHKMTGAAAVVGTPSMQLQANGRLEISTTVKALGVLGIYISSLESWEGEWGEHVLVLMRERVVPVHT